MKNIISYVRISISARKGRYYNLSKGCATRMHKLKDSLIIGFALFAMFFGAGNLIFPPYLGLLAGNKGAAAAAGFLVAGVGLPLLGILACGKMGGTFIQMTGRVGTRFSLLTTSCLILAIGPMLAIPRVAATTYELAIQPHLPWMPPVIAAVIFFAVAVAFVLRPRTVVDNVGKILTPGLLVLLAVIIFKAIFFPIGSTVDTAFQKPFSSSLLEGYQTMDAMAAVIFAGIILSAAKAKGYRGKDLTGIIVRAGVVAAVGLSFVYGGLLHMGTQASSLFPAEISRTTLLMKLTQLELGGAGGLVLGLVVALACLTTAIGLLATSAGYFSHYLFNDRISYQSLAVFMAVVSAGIAVFGVDAIVQFSAPVLTVLYPVVITLIVLTLMGPAVGDEVVRFTTYVALLVSLMDVAAGLTGITALKGIVSLIPLADAGFAWVFPTLTAFIFSAVYMFLTKPVPVEQLRK